MPYSIDHYARMRALHDRIHSTRANVLTAYGRQWVKVMNDLRERIGYALPRHTGWRYWNQD
jgi:hypothetical protein